MRFPQEGINLTYGASEAPVEENIRVLLWRLIELTAQH